MQNIFSYCCRNTELDAEQSFELQAETLSWVYEGKSKGQLSYASVESIQLIKDGGGSGPRGMASTTTTNQIDDTAINLTVNSSGTASAAEAPIQAYYLTVLRSKDEEVLISCGIDQEPQDYKIFILELNNRLKLAKPDIQFRQGSKFSFIANLIGMVIWVILCRFMLRTFAQESGSPLFIAIIIALIVGLMIGAVSLLKARPRPYDPGNIPSRLLPQKTI